jgi:hypothetical protein
MRRFVASFVAASLLTLAMPVEAHGARYVTRHHHHPHYVHRGWIAPAIVGGIIAGAVVHQTTQPPIVYTETAPVWRLAPVCTEWREVRTEDGRIIQERTCTQQ